MRVFLALLASVSLATANPLIFLSGQPPTATAPTGNSWTIGSFTSGAPATTIIAPAGSTGDIIVVWVKWNGTTGPPALTGVTGDVSGAFTLRGTQVSHGVVDLYGRFATIVATSAASENVSLTFTGSSAFVDICLWRLSASGTKDYSVVANGTGTSAAAITGTFTTATVNGITLVGVGLYDQPTFSAQTIGGNTPTNTRSIAGWLQVWDYLHTAQLSGATAGCSFSSGSTRWVIQVLSLSAQ